MKVFELAKELGIETLSLMDEIKSAGFVVKNHMVVLDDQLISDIKSWLSKKSETASAKKKKKVTKKKAASKKVVTKKTTKKVTKKVTKKKLTKQSVSSSIEKPTVKKKTQIKKTNKISAEKDLKENKIILRRKSEVVIKPLNINTKESTSTSIIDSDVNKEKFSGAKVLGKIDIAKKSTTKSPTTNQPSSYSARSRGLRPGFSPDNSVQSTVPSVNSFDKKREVKIVKKEVPKTTTGLGEVPKFSVSDFRKREVVFPQRRKKILSHKDFKKTLITESKSSKRVVEMGAEINISNLAAQLNIKPGKLIKVLIKNGIAANINMSIDFDTVSLIVPEFNFSVRAHVKSKEDVLSTILTTDSAESAARPPIVTVMGHVDHGKTSLLDIIRSTKVTEKEAGGITQHIGAYKVKTSSGADITFLDTPGHAAFTAMRARGAQLTDIVIIVVAADDGVMPQTIEAINHALDAQVPILVAINKIDAPGANLDKVKKELSEHNLVSEDWGGENIFCEISALKNIGIDSLLDSLALMAEMLELKTFPKNSGQGVVIENFLLKGLGNVANILVKDGSVKVGDYLVVDTLCAKVRRILDDTGKVIKIAQAGDPIQITGFDSGVGIGETFYVCKTEKEAKSLIEAIENTKTKEFSSLYSSDPESVLAQLDKNKITELKVILKADVGGSLEAIKAALEKMKTDEVAIKILHSGVGDVTESDVLLGSTTDGVNIIGFNVKANSAGQKLAKEKNIEVKIYSIIYELLDDLKEKLSGLLTPDKVEKIIGQAEVREVFSVSKVGVIAGCMVTDGKAKRNNKVRLVREGKTLYEGEMSSLKRFKDDAKEVAQGYECGIGLKDFNDIKSGDTMELFTMEEIKRKLVLEQL
ncbi:MAG: translation initiation factor IF-2 [Bdellovibrionaceae bacterium]|nr:translation initiation factor IF-2 [Pseudobdellovibrionaceae bacterium]